MNEFGKYRLFRKYVSSDGVNYTPLNEYQALLVENNSCQCGYRELEYRFDGEYKNETFKKYEIWNEYSFCPTDSSYDELTGNVDYRNPIANEGVVLTTYIGVGSTKVKLCNSNSFYESIAINNVEKGSKYTGYTFNNTDINEVAYSNVKSITEDVFSGCTNLTSVVIGDGVKSISHSAFNDCTKLTSVTIGNSVGWIGDSFYNCSSLTSIVIPDSVTNLSNSFYNCRNLKSVTIGNSVKKLGGGTFDVYGTFSNCSSLTSVTIPNSVTSIGSSAFRSCTSLTSVTIGNSVTDIWYNAFRSCTKLTSVEIPDSVTRIMESAFYNCRSLTSVTIGNSVTSIGDSAFSNCSGLTSIAIPSSVTSIGDYAFEYCSSLTSITCYATTKPSLGSSTFSRLPKNGTLHVPSGSDYSSWLKQLPSGWTIEYI